ncbi:MAG: ribosome maturation factor RimP [Arenicellaceae bacterium]|nr:ribosome maturation factor RimP [Arenicellaceae bacterium]
MALTVEHLHNLLEPGAEALGFEVVAVQVLGRERPTLRIYIDGPDGVGLADCAKASYQFGVILDVDEPVSGAYDLEVSSPGTDRPLVKPDHFKAAIGQNVRLRLKVSQDNRRRFTGELLAADEESAVVKVEGEEFSLNYNDMDKARVVPSYE